MRGKIEVHRYSQVAIHHYVAGHEWMLASSLIIETPNALVLLDAQFSIANATEVAQYAAELNKPVERIIISHGHPDHWFGLLALMRRFPDAPIYSVDGVAQWITEHGPWIIERYRTVRPDDIPPSVTAPDRVLPEQEVTIDGVTFDFQAVDEAEAQIQLITRLPEDEVLLAVDIVWPAANHVVLGDAYFENWLKVLEGLDDDRSHSHLHVGHGARQDRSAISATADYIRDASEVYANASGPDEFVAELKSRQPNRQYPEWVDFGAGLLFRSRA